MGGAKLLVANSSCVTSREVKDGVLEELVHDTMSAVPQHTVHDLPPFTNVSLRLLLSNPEGWKQSEELPVLTDEDGRSGAGGAAGVQVCNLSAVSSSWCRPGRVHPGQQLRAADQPELEGTAADVRSHPEV